MLTDYEALCAACDAARRDEAPFKVLADYVRERGDGEYADALQHSEAPYWWRKLAPAFGSTGDPLRVAMLFHHRMWLAQRQHFADSAERVAWVERAREEWHRSALKGTFKDFCRLSGRDEGGWPSK